MTERSYFWGGTVTGDATLAPYDDDEFSDIWRKLFTTDRSIEGILRGFLNELEVSNPAGVTIRVKTGAAMVDGKFYETTAVVDNVVVVPGAGSNYYTIVLRKDWALQTVRVAVLGPDVGAPPVVTQNDGITWEISLATVQVASGGAITITDTREFCHFSQTVNTDNIEDGAVTLAKLDPSIQWSLIESDVIGVDGTLIDWVGIPSNYSNLRIIIGARSTAFGGGLVDAGLRLNFNGDAAANYRSVDHEFPWNSGTATPWDSGVIGRMRVIGGVNPDSDAAGEFGMVIIDIRNYSSTILRKYAQWHCSIEGATIFEQYIGHGYWNSIAAINRIQISSNSNVGSADYGFMIGSEFRLYGMP